MQIELQLGNTNGRNRTKRKRAHTVSMLCFFLVTFPLILRRVSTLSRPGGKEHICVLSIAFDKPGHCVSEILCACEAREIYQRDSYRASSHEISAAARDEEELAS
jgi:hypothetical protein